MDKKAKKIFKNPKTLQNVLALHSTSKCNRSRCILLGGKYGNMAMLSKTILTHNCHQASLQFVPLPLDVSSNTVILPLSFTQHIQSLPLIHRGIDTLPSLTDKHTHKNILTLCTNPNSLLLTIFFSFEVTIKSLAEFLLRKQDE